MGGADYARRVLELLARARPRNEIVLELFSTVADDYLARVGRALPRWSLEITLESHVERLRRLNRRFACPDEEIERTVGEALKNGAGRIDIFFMVGLPGQTYEDAVGFDSFCRRLLERFKGDPRLEFFVAPLAPFLDPGSSAYEEPARHGYRVRFRTLEEYRAALAAPSWKEMLNYETDSMTREEVAAATYEALRRLTRLKREWRFISEADCADSLRRIAASERAVGAADEALRLPEGPRREAAVREARAGASGPAAASLFQKNYLVWPLLRGRRFAPLRSLAFVGFGLALREARLFITRRLPLYLSQSKGEAVTKRLRRGRAGAA